MFRRYLAAWPEAQRTRQREVIRIDSGEKSVLVKRPEHGAQAEENREKARLPKQGRRGFPEFETESTCPVFSLLIKKHPLLDYF